MEAEPIRSAKKPVGAQPAASSIAVGAVGVAGGVIGGWLGMWLAAIIVGPVNVEDPWNLLGNAILALGPLLAMAAGAVLGFVVGVVAASALLVLSLDWPENGRTIVYLAIMEAVAVPPVIWLMVTIGNSSDGAGSLALWVAAFVVGGLNPMIARLLSFRVSPR